MAQILLAAEDLQPNGGLEISVLALAKHLGDLGHRVTVGMRDAHAGAGYDLVWTHHWKKRASTLKLEGILRRGRSKLWVQLHDYRDFCLTGRKAIGPGMMTCEKALTASCFAVHGIQGCGKGRNPFPLFEKFSTANANLEILRSAEKVLVYSDAVATVAEANRISGKRIEKTTPWTDLKADRTAAPGIEPVVVWCGRLVDEKGPMLFLEAFDLMQKERPDTKAVLVGDGPVRVQIESFIRARGLESKVSLKGWLSRNEVDGILKIAHHVVVTSLWPEPFGLVGIEAFAQSVPVIACDRGGIREWCNEADGGILLESALPEKIASSSLQLLNSESMRDEFSNRAGTAFTRKYSRDAQMARLETLMRDFR